MDVLLAVPINRPSEAQVSINDNGLGFIAAAFESVGANVTLFSWNMNLSKEMFQQKLLEIRPDIFGLKVFTVNIVEALNTLQIVREILPEAIILIGGPHPSMSKPEDVFFDFGDLIDYAIAGDGESSVVALANLINAAGGKPEVGKLIDVPGLIYKNNNKIFINDKCFHIELSALPKQNWGFQNPVDFTRVLDAGSDIETLEFQGRGPSHNPDSQRAILFHDSRGCHARCGHCGSWLINGPESRKQPLNEVFEELDMLIKKLGVRVIEFTGNELLEDLNYFKELCNWFIELEVPVRWGCTGGPNAGNLLNEELLELMHRAGCTTIHYGVESGSPAVRRREKKPLSLSKISDIVKLAESKGIRVEGGFMFGFSDETVDEMNETILYAFSIPFSMRAFVICLPLPGTRGYENVLKKYGIKRIDWLKYDFNKPKLLPTAASLSQVRRMLFKAKVLRKFPFILRMFLLINRNKISY